MKIAMKKPLNIPQPDLKSAQPLTPLQLNAFRFDPKHTVLTTELLEKMASSEKKGASSGKSSNAKPGEVTS